MSERKASHQGQTRYTGVAVGLHWLIAALIIGMLAVGKWMTDLDAENPLRFTLTQWHKSFGIAILALSLFRIFWRRTHKPPVFLERAAWEKKVANAVYTAFYVLLLCIPLSGWLLVSASPLNIQTVLFQTIPWPHIPVAGWFGQSAEQLTESFHFVHDVLSNLLLLLLFLHVAAALRHHFILKDALLSRMSLFTAEGKIAGGLGPLLIIVTSIAAGILVLNKTTATQIPTALATGEVRFTASFIGAELVGSFKDSEVEIKFNPDQLESALLNATVFTNTIHAEDPQISGTLSEEDWFNVKTYPQATFRSQSFQKTDSGETLVIGMLTIKDTIAPIEIPIKVESVDGKKMLKGGFVINRLDFNIGTIEQPNEEYAGFDVKIEFSFELN